MRTCRNVDRHASGGLPPRHIPHGKPQLLLRALDRLPEGDPDPHLQIGASPKGLAPAAAKHGPQVKASHVAAREGTAKHGSEELLCLFGGGLAGSTAKLQEAQG